jgi:hypothetical protein
MKAIYYYIRDLENRPMITVCIILAYNSTGKQMASRGISFCSHGDDLKGQEMDMPTKDHGRKSATLRAVTAMSDKSDSCTFRMTRSRLLNFETNDREEISRVTEKFGSFFNSGKTCLTKNEQALIKKVTSKRPKKVVIKKAA